MVAIRKPFFVVPVDLGTFQNLGAPAPGFPVSNLNRLDSMGLVYRQPDGRGARIGGVFSASTAIDFVSLIATTFHDQIAWDVTFGTGAYGTGPVVYHSGALARSPAAYTRADGRYHTHLELPAPVTADWWIISWSASNLIEIAGLVVGKKIEPTRFYDRDFERGVEDLGSLDVNRFGVPDHVPGKKLRTLQFTLSWLNEAEYENSFAPLAELVGSTGLVYCCLDPAATAWRQNRTYLGWLRNPPFARGGAKPRTWSMEFQIRSLI